MVHTSQFVRLANWVTAWTIDCDSFKEWFLSKKGVLKLAWLKFRSLSLMSVVLSEHINEVSIGFWLWFQFQLNICMEFTQFTHRTLAPPWSSHSMLKVYNFKQKSQLTNNNVKRTKAETFHQRVEQFSFFLFFWNITKVVLF